MLRTVKLDHAPHNLIAELIQKLSLLSLLVIQPRVAHRRGKCCAYHPVRGGVASMHLSADGFVNQEDRQRVIQERDIFWGARGMAAYK